MPLYSAPVSMDLSGKDLSAMEVVSEQEPQIHILSNSTMSTFKHLIYLCDFFKNIIKFTAISINCTDSHLPPPKQEMSIKSCFSIKVALKSMSTAGMAGSWWWATMDACFLSSSQ
jgi:hypothetical protein